MSNIVPFGGTLTGLLDYSVATNGSAPSMLCDDSSTSFVTLADASRRITTALAGMGIRSGDTVAIWMANCPAWMATFFGCARLGVRIAAINTRFTMQEVEEILARTDAQALFCWPASMGFDASAIMEGLDREALPRLGHIVIYGEMSGGKPPSPFTLYPYEEVLSAEPVASELALPDAGGRLG